ncbi:right-handed parallel beta-helix repeat-containing protein [Botryobacter ruber]|uniref:right-handed parallel beta-helix repeat-containing protein n=1 Tax=Botryobacter ruber TaxID=2171629 RepID=UPI0013E2BA24|nr:right-handed parallel beta-helix repeat-containing protein [Botryobacter ruber]
MFAQASIQGIPQFANGAWTIRYNQPAAQEVFEVAPASDGIIIKKKPAATVAEDVYVFCHFKLDKPIKELSFEYRPEGKAVQVPITLYDAAVNVLWQYDGSEKAPEKVKLKNLKIRGQLVFKVRQDKAGTSAGDWSHCIRKLKVTEDKQAPVLAADGYMLIDNVDELRRLAGEDNVKVRLKPGTYRIDKALFRHFIEFTGNNSTWDLKGVKFQVDTKLFSQFGVAPGGGDALMYCAMTLSGNNIVMEGLQVETYGNKPGIQSRNKIFNITGIGVTLRNVEVTTEGSNPWGYGSLFGISGGDVRKMNGIRIGWPGKDVKLIGCRVHMRAMGHAIFVQGAENTLIEDCHVDGLLRKTDEILAETSGYAFDRDFKAGGKNYIEGVIVGEDGKILPGEMVSLSEDGIRIYPEASGGKVTGTATIRNCTVTNMRRGICTGLNAIGDLVINCQVTNCVASGFNVGANDKLVNCRADAKYAEALSVPYVRAQHAEVELEILDSRGGVANNLLAKINGENHHIKLTTANPIFIPAPMVIELSTTKGYGGPRNGSQPSAKNIKLINKTPAPVIYLPGTEKVEVESIGRIDDHSTVLEN